MVTCISDCPIDDHPALRQVADLIWGENQHQADRSGLDTGVIRISSPATGSLAVTKGYGFVYQKRSDGRWHCLEDDKR